jgi:hypothetical protein
MVQSLIDISAHKCFVILLEGGPARSEVIGFIGAYTQMFVIYRGTRISEAAAVRDGP